MAYIQISPAYARPIRYYTTVSSLPVSGEDHHIFFVEVKDGDGREPLDPKSAVPRIFLQKYGRYELRIAVSLSNCENPTACDGMDKIDAAVCGSPDYLRVMERTEPLRDNHFFYMKGQFFCLCPSCASFYITVKTNHPIENVTCIVEHLDS